MKVTTKLFLATLCAVAILGIGVANAATPAGATGPAVIHSVDSMPQAVVSNIPKLGSPKNGYANNKMPRFTWRRIKSAVSYDLEVAYDAGFGSIASTQYGLLKAKGSALPFEYGDFYWHARANFADGSSSEWSETRVFYITIMKAPKNGARSSGKPVWKWKKVPGASYYILEFGTDPGAMSVFFIPSKYAAAKWADVPFPSGTTYYWRVSADNTPDMPVWSYTIK